MTDFFPLSFSLQISFGFHPLQFSLLFIVHYFFDIENGNRSFISVQFYRLRDIYCENLYHKQMCTADRLFVLAFAFLFVNFLYNKQFRVPYLNIFNVWFGVWNGLESIKSSTICNMHRLFYILLVIPSPNADIFICFVYCSLLHQNIYYLRLFNFHLVECIHETLNRYKLSKINVLDQQTQ